MPAERLSVRTSPHEITTMLYGESYAHNICISYVTAVRYVSAINHEAQGCAAPEGE